MLLSIKQILAIPDPRFPANPFYQLLSYQKEVTNPTNLVQWQNIDLNTQSHGRSDFLINHLEDTESSGTTSDSSDDFVMISKSSLNG